MSKLTDKIKELAGNLSPGGWPDEIEEQLEIILADVKELEHDLTNGAAYTNGYADGQHATETKTVLHAILAAKREAYEHALKIIEHNTRYHALQQLRSLASDAPDTEGE